MENSNNTVMPECYPASVSIFRLIIVYAIMPFHLLMIKVLVFDLRLSLPRHKATICLSISDAMQLGVSSFCVTLSIIFSVKKGSAGCDMLDDILFFAIAMTLAVSSLSTIALSVERYVACIHSFHLHRIFNRERMKYGISFIWILGVICGVLVVTIDSTSWNGKIQDERQFLKILAVTFVFPTSATISIIQYRLLVFSRKKLAQVGPGTLVGYEAEVNDFRKKQIKVPFVASIVAIAYIVCMLPYSCLSFYQLAVGDLAFSRIAVVLNTLAFVNNFVDPYIYGLGISDTRRAVFRNLRQLKNLFVRQI